MVRRKTSGNTPGATPSKRLLGQVLVDGAFISRRDLETALEEQNRTNELLGEVLVRMGVADPAEINAAVSIQSDLASLDSAVRAAAGVRLLLGELLLKAGRITPEQLELALEEQRRTGEKLGEVLVGRGLLSAGELHAVLAFQRNQGVEAPGSMRMRLGEILVSTGQITREQMDAVLARQKLTGRRFGELAVECGVVDPHQVAHGLRLQEKLLTAALLAVLSLATAAGAQDLPSSRAGHSPAGARVTVTATVQARATLKVIRQKNDLVVTSADISRGYVEVFSASLIEIRNNSPAGCLLVFEGSNGSFSPFQEVSVNGMGREVQVGPGGGWIPMPYSPGPVTADLSYRFSLSKGARPGTYAWPLSISLRPL